MPKPPLLKSAGHNPHSSRSSVDPNPYRAPKADLGAQPFERGSTGGLAWLLFSFSGRVRRATFWLVSIGSTLTVYTLALMGVLALGEEVGVAVAGLLYLPVLWVGLAVSVKRWHDRNKSGWWLLISFVPLIGPIWALVEQGFLPGDEGPNRFGSPPR